MSETIVVTSVLVVYDGSANLRLLDVVAIVLGLPIAIAVGHMLAWSLSVLSLAGLSLNDVVQVLIWAGAARLASGAESRRCGPVLAAGASRSVS